MVARHTLLLLNLAALGLGHKFKGPFWAVDVKSSAGVGRRAEDAAQAADYDLSEQQENAPRLMKWGKREEAEGGLDSLMDDLSDMSAEEILEKALDADPKTFYTSFSTKKFFTDEAGAKYQMQNVYEKQHVTWVAKDADTDTTATTATGPATAAAAEPTETTADDDDEADKKDDDKTEATAATTTAEQFVKVSQKPETVTVTETITAAAAETANPKLAASLAGIDAAVDVNVKTPVAVESVSIATTAAPAPLVTATRAVALE